MKSEESKYQQFLDAVKTAQKSRNFNELYTTMCEVFQIASIHPAVKEYIESTIESEIIPSPLYCEGFAKSYKNVAPIVHYYGDDRIPKDKFLPAIQFAYSASGHEYYLFLESGAVVGRHHDPFWAEYFDDIFTKNSHNVDKALQKFLSIYGLTTFTYTQFSKMQRICREEYGIDSPKKFPGILKGDDFVKILTECGKDENGKIICYIDDIVGSDVLEGMICEFDDFYI